MVSNRTIGLNKFGFALKHYLRISTLYINTKLNFYSVEFIDNSIFNSDVSMLLY